MFRRDFWRDWYNGEYTLVPLCIKKSQFLGQKQTPQGFCGDLFIPGGDEGIRTLDTLAGILHFQCSALDQLCDVSCNRKYIIRQILRLRRPSPFLILYQ